MKKKPDYARYELLKARLQEQNLSPEEYTRAVKEIAKCCGV